MMFLFRSHVFKMPSFLYTIENIQGTEEIMMQDRTYSLEWLRERVTRKEKVKYLFFWGHTPAQEGSVSKACLSQWWASAFEVDGVRYATAEHWMMAKKAALFGDEEALRAILQARTPGEAKALGRKVRQFDAEVWDQHCFGIVCEGSFHKFNQHPDLGAFLLNTKDRVLVEASPVDRVWGIGLAEDDEHVENPLFWKGPNLLGFALMEARKRLAGA